MVTLVVDTMAPPVSITDLEKCSKAIPFVLHYKDYLNIYINLTQLGQENDQHID